MSINFHETLDQLAHIKRNQYLSTQPGLWGSQEVMKGLYIRSVCTCCFFGRKIRSDHSEVAAISKIVGDLFNNDQIEASGADVELSIELERRLDRMGAYDKKLSNIFIKFREKVEEKALNDESLEEVNKYFEQVAEAENVSSDGNVSPLNVDPTDDSAKAGILPPLSLDKEARYPAVEGLRRRSSTPLPPLCCTRDMEEVNLPQKNVEKENSGIPNMSKEEFEETVRIVNTNWILKKPISSEENIKKIVYYFSSLQEPLTEEQSVFLARAYVALLKRSDDEDLVRGAKEIFFHYYLKNNKSTVLSEEYMALFSIIFNKPLVRDTLRFLRSSSIEGKSLPDLLKEFDTTRWQECAFDLQGFSPENPQPWKNEPSEESDRDILQRMCHTLVSSCESAEDLLTELEQVNLVLLFALSSHTYKEAMAGGMAKFKRNLRKLIDRLPALDSLLGKTIPANEAEKLKHNNFRALYQFLIGSKFKIRMNQEEKEGLFSLWFQRQSKELAGNTLKNFTIEHLLSSLEQVRGVAIREPVERRSKRKNVEEESFAVAPAFKVSLLPPEGKTSWEFFFNDEMASESGSWGQGQAMARRRAQEIASSFKKQKPMLDFDAVVEAVRSGASSVSNLLSMYEDGGLALLRDYVYPYCTLLRRAETPFDHIARKFVGGAASPKEVAELGGAIEENQVAALHNAIRLMRPEGEGKSGGFLRESVIHASQIGMLTTMVESINEGKQVYICNDTGSGKTTMAKLAPEIVSLSVPLVLHVAPFPQEEKGWTKFFSWQQLDAVKEKGIPTHFWVTAEDLARYVEKGIPQKYVTMMKKSFFLMDEYDSKEYNVVDKESKQVVLSLQDELYALGCQRIVNMSATPNIETFENKQRMYRKKLLGLEDLPEQERKKIEAYYTNKIAEVSTDKEALLARMAKEWDRQILLVELTQKTPAGHIEQVFQDIGKMPIREEKNSSFLVEMPKFTLLQSGSDLFHEHMRKTFPNTPSAILFRDSDGALQAHYTTDGQQFHILSLEEFTKKYSSFEKKPVVVCFYSQDSVGGDFGIFSNARFVEGQFIVYPEEIAPSYAIFQNMRRRRHLAAGESAPSEASIAPVRFYMGEAASQELQLTEEEGKTLEDLPLGKRLEEESARRKQKLLTKANSTAEALSRVRECSRLRMKVAHIKHKLLSKLLLVDAANIEDVIDAQAEKLVSKKLAKKEFRERLKSALEKEVITFDTEVSSRRADILRDVVSKFTMPIKNSEYRATLVQEHEAVLLLRDFFYKDDFVKQVLASKEPYVDIQKRLGSFYNREDSCLAISCLAMWVPKLQSMSRARLESMAQGERNDAVTFHPVPDVQSIKMALQRVRGKKPESVPNIEESITLVEKKHGIKELPPDLLIKAMIGTKVRDPLKVQTFFKRLDAEAAKAEAFQRKHAEYVQAYRQQIEELKKSLLDELEEVSQEESRFQPIEQLAQKYGDIDKIVRQLSFHREAYEEYSVKI